MFPNPYDIYLHDTPARDLFAHEVRAYSHGCIRLNDPRDFAYHLLAAQTADPEGFFNEILNTGPSGGWTWRCRCRCIWTIAPPIPT